MKFEAKSESNEEKFAIDEVTLKPTRKRHRDRGESEVKRRKRRESKDIKDPKDPKNKEEIKKERKIRKSKSKLKVGDGPAEG